MLFFVVFIRLFSFAETVCVGNNYTLSAPGNPALFNPWVSSDPAIASVNNSGVVTGVSAGNCVIVFTDDLGVQTNFNFTVIQYIPASLTLTSAPGTNNQQLILNNYSGGYFNFNPIIPVTYAVSPGATATLLNPASLPLGITASFSNGVFTISGAAQLLNYPMNGISFSYTIVVTSISPCGNGAGTTTATASGAFYVPCSEGPLSLPSPEQLHQTVCQGSPITPITVYTMNPSSINGVWPPGVGGSTMQISGTPTQPGVYPFTVFINFNCTPDIILSGEITVLALPSISASGPTSICQGQTVTLNSSVSSGITWSPGGLHTSSISAGSAGNYTAFTSANGKTCTSNTINITIKPLPPTPTISANAPTTICLGQSVVLTSSATSGNTWSSGQTMQSITATTSGNYTVTANLNGCTATSIPVTVTVNPLPPTPTISMGGSATICAGESIVLTSSSVSGNSWSSGQTTQSITATTAGDYVVTANLNGCTSTSSPVTITVIPTPPIPVISASGPLTFCEGDSVVLTSSALNGNFWSQNGEITQSIVVYSPGNYNVSVTENGCVSNSIGIQLNLAPLPPTPVISTNGSFTICEGESVVLTSSAITGNSWSSGQTTQNITVTDAGIYTVTANLNGCTATSNPVTVTINPLPPIPVISTSGPLTFCMGGSVDLTSSVVTGNSWSSGQTTQSITATTGGNYTVTANLNGCTATSNPVMVTINPIPPTPVISTNGSFTICEGESVVLTSSAITGNSWSSGQTTQNITATDAGIYTVTANLNGCTATSNPVTVTINPLPPIPVISTSGPLTFCMGGSVDLTSSVVTGNSWSSGQTTQSITATTGGNYTVTANLNGCTATSNPVMVTINPIPPTPVISTNGSFTICEGESVVLTSSAITGNSWSSGQTTQNITVTDAGIYTVTANLNGCTATSNPVTVTINPLPPIPVISTSGPLTFCMGGSVDLTSSVVTGNSWSSGQTTQSITATTGGNYTVTANLNGCTATSNPVMVTINPIPLIPIVSANGPLTFCEGESVILTSTATASSVWSSGQTTQSITVTTAGNYTVTANLNGCTATSVPMTVNVNPIPPVPVISANGPLTFCEGNSVILTSSASTGNVWSQNGEVTQSITVLSSGDYSVAAYQSGCSSVSVPLSVVVNPIPVVSLENFDPICNTDQPFTLSQGAPGPGIYYVNGIEETIFDPSISPVGINGITYSYQNEFGCIGEVVSTLEVYNCLSIDEQIAYSINIFPNPSKGVVTIVAGAEFTGTSIQLIDASGRLMDNYLIQSPEMQLDFSNYGSGSYLLIFSNEMFTSIRRLELVTP